MSKSTDARVTGVTLYFLSVDTRVPYKFGGETLTSVTTARCCLTVTGRDGRRETGWGETPLSVGWVWPSSLPTQARYKRMLALCRTLAAGLAGFDVWGHPIEIGHDFQEGPLRQLLHEANVGQAEPMPWLAALVCCSAFDLALHDAYGRLNGVPIYRTYNGSYMNRDLAAFLTSAADHPPAFAGRYPADYLVADPPPAVRAWHAVGIGDPLSPDDLTGDEPDDGYPVHLEDWIECDGLKCLKVKLRGADWDHDLNRLIRIGEIGDARGVDWLSADFNCTVNDVQYVTTMLDRLRDDHPRIYGMLLYVEQPFPYELEEHRIDVHAVAARKPLYMDESAHDWRLIRLGWELGWTGVALKTCKTQTGAILSACWAREHGMGLMVQDLTNPMLAQVPHLLLAAHAGTIMGLESNAMQYYPEASNFEAAVHPGAYHRINGELSVASFTGAGFGYEVERIGRPLPEADVVVGDGLMGG